MGKYIIELKRGETAYKTVNSNGTPLIQLLAPTPYTELDLGQVREKAYIAGLKDGQGITIESQQNNAFNDEYKKCLKNFEQVRKEAYEKGLSDAWEVARTLWNTPIRKRIFGHTAFNTAITTLTAQEAVEKIRQYKKEQKEIQVGDEVISPDGKGVVTEITDIYVRIMYAKGSGQVVKSEDLTKTGRHFPEIAEVLQKMKEAQ